MGLFPRREVIIDPWNTMGDPAATARTIPAPYRDSYTPDRVATGPDRDISRVPLESIAVGYGLTLPAAKRFRASLDAAASQKGTTRGARAMEECRNILASKQNRKRW